MRVVLTTTAAPKSNGGIDLDDYDFESDDDEDPEEDEGRDT